MSTLIHCPSCNSPLRIPDDSGAATFTCPRCQADIPNPTDPSSLREGRDEFRAGNAGQSRRQREDAEAFSSRKADVLKPGTDPGMVSVILSSVVLAAALGGLLYLQFGPPFAEGQSMTSRKHGSGVLLLLGLVLMVVIPIASVYVARGRASGSWIAGLILTILGGIAALILLGTASLVFMVSSCLEPCDSKSHPPPQKQAPAPKKEQH